MELAIHHGRIRGGFEQGMYAFKNIPFGAAPVGSLRFKPPIPAPKWDGVLDCTKFGPRPIQTPPPWCVDRDIAVYAEDCLNLNVWTPGVDMKKRPVVFYIYGGGHMEGSNSESGWDGPHLVGSRDIVMVCANYRVGALGYLYLEKALGEGYEASGCLGLLDQILALKWVKENIAFFGGDPDRVTIMGQSAGGKSVMNLLVSPLAKGLFHQAIAMSGALQSIKDASTSAKLTQTFLHAIGLGEKDALQVLEKSPREIAAAQEKANETYFKAESYGPTADGIVLPEDVESYILAGNLPKIPVLMGHTLEELYLQPGTDQTDIDDESLRKKLTWKFGLGGGYVFDQYKKARRTMEYAGAYGHVATDYTYVQAFLRTASLLVEAGLPVWLYRWDFRGGTIAHHSSDNEALFQRMQPAMRLGHEASCDHICEVIRDAWLSFIETGSPACASLPGWPACQQGNAARMLLNHACRLEPIALDGFDRDFPLQVMRLAL